MESNSNLLQVPLDTSLSAPVAKALTLNESTQSIIPSPPDNLSHNDKLKQMHKSVQSIICKSHQLKSNLQVLLSENNAPTNEIKIDSNSVDESHISNLSRISNSAHPHIWEALKSVESQLSTLQEKVKAEEAALANRRQNRDELKSLIEEVERVTPIQSTDKTAQCTTCLIY